MNQWSKTTSHQRRDSDNLQYGELRSYRGSRLVKFVLWIFINFTDIHETGESFFFIFFILTFFTYIRRNFGSRKGRFSPVPVSNLVDDGSGGDSEIPEWLQEFRENLVDDEIPLRGGSHASSSHEVSLEPTTERREDLGKHNVHTHFPKDRNCEIC